MFTKKFIINVIFFLTVLLAACTARQEESPATPSPAATITTYDELVAALEATGATVIEGGPVDQDPYGVPGRYLSAGGARVEVYEFADEAARQAAFDRFTYPSHNTSGYYNVWNAGRLIVYYDGANASTRQFYSNLLGRSVRLVVD
jgi:hypothetical protein